MSKRLVGIVLGAIFAAFLSWPAQAVEYFFETGQGGSACTTGDRCDSIADANGLSLSAGDNLNFNCTDTFSDAILDLDDAGSDGSPITVQAGGVDCPGTNPIFDGTSLARNWDVDTAWIACQSVDLKFNSPGGGQPAQLNIKTTGTDFVADDCNVTGNGNAAGSTAIGAHANGNITFSNLTTTLCSSGCINLQNAAVVTGTNITFGSYGLDGVLSNGGDALGSETNHTGSSTWTTLSFDDGGIDDPDQEECIDFKGSGTHTITDADIIACHFGVIVHDDAVLTISDSTLDISMSGSNKMIQLNSTSEPGTGSAALHFLRTLIVSTNVESTGPVLQLGDTTSGQVTTFSMFASTVEISSGNTSLNMFRIQEDVAIDMRNNTFISRNGNTLDRMLWVETGYGGTGVTLRNNIIDTNCTDCFNIETDVADPFTNDNNLYENGNAGDWLDINGTGHNESEVTSTFETNGATGDPLFSNIDETSDLYLMLTPASPGIGIGDAAFLYAGATSDGDLLGYPFRNLTPNAGARAHRWRTKFPRFGLNLEITPIELEEDEPEEETAGIWPMFLECKCETPNAVNDNWPLALECECVQSAR